MKIIASNRRARHDYELKEKFEAGLVLSDPEVKSVKAGHIDMKGSYVSIRQGEAFLIKAHISPYKQAMDLDNYDPEGERKLLLHRKELNRLIEESQSQRLTIVPTAIGLSRGRIKLEIALARGKKLYDKRESKKQQTMLRDARLENTK